MRRNAWARTAPSDTWTGHGWSDDSAASAPHRQADNSATSAPHRHHTWTGHGWSDNSAASRVWTKAWERYAPTIEKRLPYDVHEEEYAYEFMRKVFKMCAKVCDVYPFEVSISVGDP